MADRMDDLAEVIVRRFLQLCENPRTRDRMLGLITEANESTRASGRIYRLVYKRVVVPTLRLRGVRTSAARSELLAAHLIGVALLRYVVELEPIASLSIDQVVQMSAPAVRAIITGKDVPVDETEDIELESDVEVDVDEAWELDVR